MYSIVFNNEKKGWAYNTRIRIFGALLIDACKYGLWRPPYKSVIVVNTLIYRGWLTFFSDVPADFSLKYQPNYG